MERVNETDGKKRGLEIYNFMINNNIAIKCPSCSGRAFVRGGYNRNGTVRLICKMCNYGFLSTVNTVFEGTNSSLDEIITTIYDMAMPIINDSQKPIYHGHRSNSKKWMMNHKILQIVDDIMLRREPESYNFVLNLCSSTKNRNENNVSSAYIKIKLSLSNNNCYLVNDNIENMIAMDCGYSTSINCLTKYLMSTKRTVSKKYINLYIRWFSFVNDYLLSKEIVDFTTYDAEQILIEITKHSVRYKISNTLKTLVAR